MSLKDAIIEAIAKMYATTPNQVEADIAAMSLAKDNLDHFCDAMQGAGY
jgi:hypothetical protein